MGDFQKVTAGSGILTVNSADAGFIKGPAKVTLGLEKIELWAGLPQAFQGALVTKIIHKIEAPLAQLDADTLSKCSGFTPVTVIDGSQVTVTAIAKTFVAAGAFETIVLAGPTVADLVVTENVVEAPDTYTVTDDYILDAVNGVIYRNPSGVITQGQTVKVAYKYTPPASKRLNIGAAWAILNLTNVQFQHTRPNGKKLTHFMHLAQASGNVELSYDSDAKDFVMTNFSIQSVDDTANNPTSPHGYWDDAQ